MANGLGGNMFSGFLAKPMGLSNAIGQGIGAWGQAQQQKQERHAELQAADLLQKSLQTAQSDPEGSQAAFIQAIQMAPDFVNNVLGGLKTQAPKGTQDTALMKEYQLAQQQGFSGSLLDYQNATNGTGQKTSEQRNFETYQELKKNSPEDAEAFGKSAGFIDDSGNELSVHLQKRLSTATDTAMESRNAADTMSALADDIENSDFGGGLFGGSWGEAFKRATGNEDAESELRRKYYAIRGSQVVKNLPPGAASDTDIALALAGFPNENANAKTIASFLRGVSKLEAYNADYNDFAAEYISTNGTERGMIKAWKETGKSAADAYTQSSEKVVKWDEL